MTGRILKLDLDGHATTGARTTKSKPAAARAADLPAAMPQPTDGDAAAAAPHEYADAPPTPVLAVTEPPGLAEWDAASDPLTPRAADGRAPSLPSPLPQAPRPAPPPPGVPAATARVRALAPPIAAETPAPQPLPAAAPAAGRAAVFYIDADNQSAQCAAELVAAFRNDFGVVNLRAVIAGNNSGRQIQLWADELSAAAPGIEAIGLDCPSRKDAADLALIMELGASLESHRARAELVVVVSRDDLLVGAAERAKAHGCRAYSAYVDSDPPCCRSSRVTTLLLPPAAGRNRDPAPPPRRLVSTVRSFAARDPAAPVGQPIPAPVPAAAPPPAAATPKTRAAPPADPLSDPAWIIAHLRERCPALPDGAYGASQVGQALKALGLDEKARRRFLASAPGIQSEGKASHKVYRF